MHRGLAPSPVQSDISILSMRSPVLPGESVTQLASRIQWEHLQRAYYHSPGPGRRFSPASLAGERACHITNALLWVL